VGKNKEHFSTCDAAFNKMNQTSSFDQIQLMPPKLQICSTWHVSEGIQGLLWVSHCASLHSGSEGFSSSGQRVSVAEEAEVPEDRC